ncbi:MAG TPA: BlaI/MecI/CopY family transcriptional regulator [Terriglobus sp.]
MIGRRKGSSTLTQMELQFMDVLWQQKGSSSVQQVQDALIASGNELAYTTVQTVLNTLEKKGKVTRQLDGRAYVYLPAITKESILKQAVRDLADRMFGGSSEDLVMSLIQTREVDAKRIAKLARKIADKEKD